MVGDAAKAAFDYANKRGAFYIDRIGDDYTRDITWDFNTAKAFDAFTEVYVVGKDFSWTYIKTHEEMCGSYFLKLKHIDE